MVRVIIYSNPPILAVRFKSLIAADSEAEITTLAARTFPD